MKVMGVTVTRKKVLEFLSANKERVFVVANEKKCPVACFLNEKLKVSNVLVEVGEEEVTVYHPQERYIVEEVDLDKALREFVLWFDKQGPYRTNLKGGAIMKGIETDHKEWL